MTQKKNEDDAEVVAIPAVRTDCSVNSDAACADAANEGDGLIVAIFQEGTTCADLLTADSLDDIPAAINVGTMTCDGTICEGTASDESGWANGSGDVITTIEAGEKSVAAVFDFNNNWEANDQSPDSGDLFCCIDGTTIGLSPVDLPESTTGWNCQTL